MKETWRRQAIDDRSLHMHLCTCLFPTTVSIFKFKIYLTLKIKIFLLFAPKKTSSSCFFSSCLKLTLSCVYTQIRRTATPCDFLIFHIGIYASTVHLHYFSFHISHYQFNISLSVLIWHHSKLTHPSIWIIFNTLKLVLRKHNSLIIG